MRKSPRRTPEVRAHATSSAKAALDPYIIDEITFTREEILRARAAADTK